jgi:hypothetical protein
MASRLSSPLSALRGGCPRRWAAAALALGGLVLTSPARAGTDSAASTTLATGLQLPAPASALPRLADPLTGQRSRLGRDWVGLRTMAEDTPILVMAGHADSQGIQGSGTSGAAVALGGAAPMLAGITDELYWNTVIALAVEQLGQQRGLNIRYYQPPSRTIVDGNHPATNWSVGRAHAAAGGYALEIHFDAYGPDGIGSGLIPPLHRPFSRIDESLAREFGGYPMNFRDRLGGPKRGIGLLEIGKLEGTLEASLRDPLSRDRSVWIIASRIVRALEIGLGRPSDGSAAAAAAPLPSAGGRTARIP